MQGRKASQAEQKRMFPMTVLLADLQAESLPALASLQSKHSQTVSGWGGGTCRNIDPVALWAVTAPSMAVSYWLRSACQDRAVCGGSPCCSSFASTCRLLLKQYLMWEIIRGNFCELYGWYPYSPTPSLESLFSSSVQVLIIFTGSASYLTAGTSFIFKDLNLLWDQRYSSFKLRTFITNTF